ncbi:MAG: Nudix family hydrolase [Pseudohongiella sp.]|nr:Nudix family hydrolase [Pseudohongiella sp.]
MTELAFIHVAVGVIVNSSNEVLISLRPAQSHQGGLWEFPGGKLEAGEDALCALRREFAEELGIDVQNCFPLKKIKHHYADKSVVLDVWQITEYRGTPRGREGQAIEWRAIQNLNEADFPAANAGIIRTLNLPAEIAITPDVANFAELTQLIQRLLSQNLRIIQFRQKKLDGHTYLEWFEWAQAQCLLAGTKLMFNQDMAISLQAKALDYHASSQRLMSLKKRPIDQNLLFSASCHTLEELKHAETLEADFVFLSPVADTKKYTRERILGWQAFRELANQASVPVYALGGVSRNDLITARAHGGSGIAGISTFAGTPL